MNHPTFYTKEELTWIVANAADFTANEIAFELGLGESVVRNIGTRYNLKFKRSGDPNGSEKRKINRFQDLKLIPDPPKVVYERPPAMYTQVKSPYGVATEMRKL